jgi:hypothetical protein
LADIYQLIRRVGLDNVQVYDHHADLPVIGSSIYVFSKMDELQKQFPNEQYVVHRIEMLRDRWPRIIQTFTEVPK